MISSLALMKTRLAVLKLIYSFDVTPVDKDFDLEERSKHYGGPWITPPVMLRFWSRSEQKIRSKQQ